MFGAVVQAAATLLLATSLAVYLCLRSARSSLRGPLLGVLAALVLWSIGVIWRFTASSEASAYHGFVLGWLGVASLPPLWLLLGARFARIQALEQRPLLALAAFVPSGLAWIALASNDLHHLFLTSFTRTSMERGPLFFAWMTWAYPMILVGLGLFLVAARRGPRARRWPRLLAIATVAVFPTSVSLLFVFEVLPLPYDPTPAALGLSVVVMTFGIFRMQLLDALPLARRDVIDHLRDGVLITDADGVLVDANPAALQILDRPLEAVRGELLQNLLLATSRADRPAARPAAAIAAPGPNDSLPSAELRTPADRSLEVTAKCLRSADGSPLGRFVVLRDRTEERKYERLLRQSQKLETVGSLAAGVAHELNNPLAFVRANLHHLERLAAFVAKQAPELAARGAEAEAEELAEAPQIVAECLDGIDRIRRIVDAMRRFSRLPGDELAAVDLNAVAREAIRLAELHSNRGVMVEAWLTPGLPAVHGSSQRLTQVFLNLLVNAKQALSGRGDGQITVRTRLVRDIVEIVVMDDGPGVPAEIRDRIFDPFFTTKGPEEGTGLGLSIAFDIVREHGGILELKPGPSGGACFVTHLPTHADADALAASAAAGG